MKCHEFINGTFKKSIVIAKLNLIFYLYVLIGQIIILADLKMGIPPHNFIHINIKAFMDLQARE